ncbi:glycosyltransferase family 4 protein [Omnitrophica bacterium]|nr:glycosyltransferase family 4 protein [Candidatus Omnitrophota bacterium]
MAKRSKKNNRLSIAQLHWGFPPIIGGVETHLSIMLPEMARRGHEVNLLTASVEGEKVRDAYKGVNIYRTPLMDLNWLSKRGLRGLDREIYKTFEDFFDRTRPDIIHCHNMHYFSPIHTKTVEDLARRKGTPLILTAHNVWDDILFLELTLRIKWNRIIAVSHFIKRELIGVGCDDRKIAVIHHGIDSKMFRPGVRTDEIKRRHPELKDKRVIFHPARMGLAKGCDVGLKALNIVRKQFPDAMLVLAGTKNIIDWGGTQQKDIAYMVDLVKTFDLRDKVVIDAYTLKEIAQLYGVAEVCIYPSSVGEPFGLTMLEALSSAKPMIVTDAGGMPEIIRDGINGYVIPVKDFEALASRIIRLFTDQDLQRRFGDTGRQMVESYYTKEIVTKNTIDIYKKELGCRK